MGVHVPPPDTAASVKLDLINMLAEHAQRRHRFAALIKAGDDGAALLDALGLSPLALDVMDEMIACRDMLDGDADFESEEGYDLPEGDDERCGSEHDGSEHSLGSLGLMDQRHWSAGAYTDLELDQTDCVAVPYRRETCETIRARREEMRDLRRRAETLRQRMTGHFQPDPDTLQFIADRNSGGLIAVWGGYAR